MVLRIEAPAHAGARDQARDLVEALGSDIEGQDVVLDCKNLIVGTPSFLDEVVKQVLVGGRASTLSVHQGSARVQDLLQRSAENRGLRDRLLFAVPS